MPADHNATDTKLLEIYNDLRSLLEQHGDELPPYQERNALKALACLWQISNGLDAEPGQLYEVGA